MRIATWNLEGRWTPRHRWLISFCGGSAPLTEEFASVEIPGQNVHCPEVEMQPWDVPSRRSATRAASSSLHPRVPWRRPHDRHRRRRECHHPVCEVLAAGSIVPRERFLKLFDAEA